MIGSEPTCGLLSFANIDDERFFELQARFARHELPKISPDGIVLHVAHGVRRRRQPPAAARRPSGARFESRSVLRLLRLLRVLRLTADRAAAG